MALVSGSASSSDVNPDDGGAGSGHVDAPGLRLFVMALFFIFGGITSLNDVIIPKLKELFTLSYMQAMLVQTAFFAAYAIISIPATAVVKRVGYMRGAALGLVTMMAGCLLFIPASASATFGVFLFALFVLASGVTIVQVVANPLISLLGPARTASSRLTFAQAFNSLGTTIFPLVGAGLILGSLKDVKAAAEAESRSWIATCPHCGASASIWDLGGIRYKASGTPSIRFKCPSCGKSGMHRVEKKV